jgi:hypothetical protein
MRQRIVLVVQLLVTLAIFAWVPGNAWKAGAFLALWLATFWPLTRREVVLYVVMSAFFAVLDVMSVSKGVFQFDHPDLLGLPIYEFFMWGFYLLHGFRMLDGRPPEKDLPTTLVLVAVFALPFVTIPDQQWLTVAAGLVLLAALIRYHAPQDLAYVGYFALLGAAVEFVGVHSGQWHYPTPPAWGVPFWFLIMWGGVGLFARRLIQRWVYPERANATTSGTSRVERASQ